MTESKPLTKIHVHQLFNVLGQLRDRIQDPRRVYTITKLRNELNAEAVSVNEMMKPMAAFDALQKKRVALGQEYAERDENNKPKLMPGGTWIIPDDKKAEYDEKMTALMDASKEILTEQAARSQSLQAFLAEPAETTISETLRLPVSCLPVGVNGSQMEVLFPILIDDTENDKS